MKFHFSWGCLLSFILGLFAFQACSSDDSVAYAPESGDDAETEIPSDSIRVIDPTTGDTILIYDTTSVQPLKELRWVGNSALLITEISPLNLNWLDGDGDDPAWVEIYNAGNVSANLKHYALVENLKDPRKWEFGDELIAAKSFRTVFCDKKNITSVYGKIDVTKVDGKLRYNRTHTNWKMDKDGGTIYLIDGSNGIRDSVQYPKLAGGVSWGIVDGGDWKYFETSTPEKPNTASKAFDGFSGSVTLPAGGFYPDAFTLQPPTSSEGTVRCTFDGSVPTASTPAFTEAKDIESNTVVRCGVFADKKITKDISTETYFVGEDVKMPVVAISVNPEFFSKYYKKTDGGEPDMKHDQMYAPNESFPNDSGEMPAHVEYFENGSSSKAKAWEIEAGISLMGGWSRMERKKSVAVVMREEYEAGWLNYPLFETRKEFSHKFKAFNLRNNGNRFVADYFADAVGGAILEGSGVDYQRSRQVVVFYNGKYYGIHDMRERYNKNYVESNYGIDANTVNFVKHLNRSVSASNGTEDDYLSMLSFIAGNDMSVAANYEKAKTLIDVGNFADYMIAEMYVHNGDWPDNNVRAWKSPEQPWKFMIYDLDHGFNWNSNWAVSGFSSSTNMFDWVRMGGKNGCNSGDKCFATLYNKLIKNENFKRLFINHASVMFNTYLNGKNVSSKVSFLAGMLDASDVARDMDVPSYQYRRESYGDFDPYGETLGPWAAKRDDKVEQEYVREFGLSGKIGMTISSTGNGYVLMDEMKLPSTNYTGTFFGGNMMELTAVPSAGATFAGWSDGSSENPHIITPKDGMKITASFK